MASPLRDKVDNLLKEYAADSVLQMLVHAVEDLNDSGQFDPEDSLPRPGNWCGIYTTLFEPLMLTMGFKKVKPEPKKSWWSNRATKA